MTLELHGNHGKVTLDTIRRLYCQNSRFILYKLIQKIHPAEMAWILIRLSPQEHLSPPLLILLVYRVIFRLL